MDAELTPAKMHETFIADWQNYLHELGLVMTWSTDSETKLEATMQAELTQEAIAQEAQIDSTLFTVWKRLVRDYGDRTALRDPHPHPINAFSITRSNSSVVEFRDGTKTVNRVID